MILAHIDITLYNQVKVVLGGVVGFLGVVIVVEQFSPDTALSTGLLFLLAYYIYILNNNKKKVKKERTKLIAQANKLDEEFNRISTIDAFASEWDDIANSIPEPNFTSLFLSTLPEKINRLANEIEKREDSITRFDRATAKYEAYIDETDFLKPPNHVIVENISSPDSEAYQTGCLQIKYVELIVISHIIVRITDEHPGLFKLNKAGYIDRISSIDEIAPSSGELEYCQQLTEFATKILTIRTENPGIDIEDATAALNGAIDYPSTVQKALAETETAYSLLHLIRLVKNFLDDVDISYTDLDEADCLLSIDRAISTGNVDELESLVKRIDSIAGTHWRNHHLHQFSWQEFEQLVADVWSANGYKTTVTPPTGDGGFDVRAFRRGIGQDHLLIEVKQYKTTNRVGRPVVQQTVGTLDTDRADRAGIVTSSEFTRPAIVEAAKAGSKLKLVNGDELVEMLNRSNLVPPSRGDTKSTVERYRPTFEPEKTLFQIFENPHLVSSIVDSGVGEKSDSTGFNPDTNSESTSPPDDENSGAEHHPFENITNPNQPVEKSTDFGECCPICMETDSIWKTRNINSNRPRYKCMSCDTKWRREITADGLSLWKTHGGPEPNTRMVQPEWRRRSRE